MGRCSVSYKTFSSILGLYPQDASCTSPHGVTMNYFQILTNLSSGQTVPYWEQIKLIKLSLYNVFNVFKICNMSHFPMIWVIYISHFLEVYQINHLKELLFSLLFTFYIINLFLYISFCLMLSLILYSLLFLNGKA